MFAVYAKVPAPPPGGNVYREETPSAPVAFADSARGAFPPPAPLPCVGCRSSEITEAATARPCPGEEVRPPRFPKAGAVAQEPKGPQPFAPGNGGQTTRRGGAGQGGMRGQGRRHR